MLQYCHICHVILDCGCYNIVFCPIHHYLPCHFLPWVLNTVCLVPWVLNTVCLGPWVLQYCVPCPVHHWPFCPMCVTIMCPLTSGQCNTAVLVQVPQVQYWCYNSFNTDMLMSPVCYSNMSLVSGVLQYWLLPHRCYSNVLCPVGVTIMCPLLVSRVLDYCLLSHGCYSNVLSQMCVAVMCPSA